MYSINFAVTKNKFCLSVHYNGGNSYLFICYWSTDYMTKTGLTGYVYDFSADYNAFIVDDIKDIHNYLMKKK